MTEPFTGPAASTGVDYATYNGALLLIEVKALEHNVRTKLGEKDAIRGDIHVLDGKEVGEVIPDTLIFPRVLISQLRPKIGGMVLGRLGQGEKKAGQNAPWVLSEPTDADRAVAVAYLDKTKSGVPF